MEKAFQTNEPKKQADTVILISQNRLQNKANQENREAQGTYIKWKINQEYIRILNNHALNTGHSSS